MAQPKIYKTESGYIVKTSKDEYYELLRSEKGFMRTNLGKSVPAFKGRLVKDIPNEIKTYFFTLQAL